VPNPYPARWTDIIDALPGGMILDDGAGGRKYPGVISLEYEAYCGGTLLADGLELPFRDDSFDAVLSQAVIEHVKEPQRYVDEVYRTLRPGGVFYAEVAFMQPIHYEPMHFFNVTPFGLDYLCRRFQKVDGGSIGTLQETIDWICRAAGVPSPGKVREPVAKDRMEAACGVWITARKP
jgi:SAM-dependent methyltransferase